MDGVLMARIRTIKPEFFTSEDIVGLSPLGRLLYIALWCEADREGRMAWKPRTFKMRYMPGDDVRIEDLCGEIVAAGLVVLYGDGLAYIPKFGVHQHVNPRESASNLPVPDASSRVTDAQVGRKEGEGREGSSVPKGTDAADAPSLPGEQITEDHPPPKADKTPEELAKSDLWRASVEVLQAGGCKSEATCRTFMGKLVEDHTFDVVQQAVAAAVTAQPPDARSYLVATCQRLKGERRDPLTVPPDPAAEAAAAAKKAEEQKHAAKVASITPEQRAAVQEKLAAARAAVTGITRNSGVAA